MHSTQSHRRRFLLTILLGAAAGCASLEEFAGELSSGGALTSSEVTAGLKEALSKGASLAVNELGSSGGYGADTALRISFPPEAEPVAKALRTLGLGSLVTALETRLNEGAEAGARRALPIFQQAIQSMTIADAMGILTGGEHAATDYFRARTFSSLVSEFRPEIDSALGQTGATVAWKEVTTRYNQIPFTSFKVDTDIVHYATERALEGLFSQIATQEAAIRSDPVARTTALLKRVFGAAAATQTGG